MSQHQKHSNSNQQGRPIEIKSKQSFNWSIAYTAVAIVAVLIIAVVISSRLTKAHAADMPTKAPANVTVNQPGYPTATGFYGILGSFGEFASSSANVGGVQTNMLSAGAAIEAGVGVQYKLGSNIFFTELLGNYTGVGGAATCGMVKGTTSCGVNGPWGITLGTAMNFNWTYPFQFIPAISGLFGGNSPSSLIPAGLVPTASVPYVELLADFDNVNANIANVGSGSSWVVAPEFRLGLTNWLPQGGGVLRTYVGYEFKTASIAITNKGSVQPGDALKFGVDYAW